MLNEVFDPYAATDPYPVDASGNALVLDTPTTTIPNTVSPASVNNWSWLAAFAQPAGQVAQTYLTQQGITTRQQNAIAAGQSVGPGSSLLTMNASGQSLLFGIPVLYIALGVGVFLMVK